MHSSVAADHSKAIYAVGTIVRLKSVHLVLDCCQRSSSLLRSVLMPSTRASQRASQGADAVHMQACCSSAPEVAVSSTPSAARAGRHASA